MKWTSQKFDLSFFFYKYSNILSILLTSFSSTLVGRYKYYKWLIWGHKKMASKFQQQKLNVPNGKKERAQWFLGIVMSRSLNPFCTTYVCFPYHLRWTNKLNKLDKVTNSSPLTGFNTLIVINFNTSLILWTFKNWLGTFYSLERSCGKIQVPQMINIRI